MKRFYFLISIFFFLFVLSCLAFSYLPTIQKLMGPSGNVLLQEYSFSWSATSNEYSITSYQYKKDSEKWINTTEATYTWNDIPRGSHTFSVKALDKNNQYSNPITWEFSNEITFPDMVLSSRNKIIKITDTATSLTGIGGRYFYYDNLTKKLLSGKAFYEYDKGEFSFLESLSIDNGYPVIGYGKILIIDTGEDIANVYDYSGNFIKQIIFVDPPGSDLQCFEGFFLDDNNFVISEDGIGNISQFNIQTEEKTILMPEEGGWFGAIYNSSDYYYFYKSSSEIYRFDLSNSYEKELIISNLPYHAVGIVVIDSRIYFTSNFGNGFYIYDMNTSELLKYYHFYKPNGLFLLD